MESSYREPSQGPSPRPAQAPPPPPVVQAPPRQRKSPWAIVAAIVAIVLLIALLSTVVSCSYVVKSVADSLGVTSSASPSGGAPHIAVIEIDGTIQYDGSSSSPSGLRSLLDQASEDDSVEGVVLFVDSGGGTAAAGEEMAALVDGFDKPVVVASGATNASAAYEISSQADYIYVAKSTAIGSIGVAMQLTDLSGLYEMLGISTEDIVSADSKDSTYGNRPLTDSEREWYQDMVDQLEAVFVQTVADGRDMEVSEVEELANGLTYTGMDAVDNGLADELGYIDDAIAKASELAGHEEALPSQRLSLSGGSVLGSALDVLGESAGSAMGESLAEGIEPKEGNGTIR